MTSLQRNYRHQRRRSFSRAFKREVVEGLLEQAATVAEVARRHDLHPNQLCRWRNEYFRGAFGATLHEKTDVAQATVLLPVELVDGEAVAASKTSMTAEASRASQQLRRLRVVLPKGQLHLEDVEPETLRLLIEVLK